MKYAYEKLETLLLFTKRIHAKHYAAYFHFHNTMGKYAINDCFQFNNHHMDNIMQNFVLSFRKTITLSV